MASVLVACGSQGPVSAPARTATGVELPVLVEQHRWFLQTKTADGLDLRMYLDSAGGMYLTSTGAEHLKLTAQHVKTEGGEADVVPFPRLADPRIPRPALEQFPVRARSALDEGDGMLGAPWFAGHTFTFDYPRQRLVLPSAFPAVPAAHLVEVGFPRDAQGEPTLPYGRIQMIVEGETIDMLFDTGATVTLTASALEALGGGAPRRATSFITQTVFDAWRAAHPEWRVIEGADRTFGGAPLPMIEVPTVTVGGFEVGPVWFTCRPDGAFHVTMAQWMDKPTEGALGGSAFHTLRITVDWTRGRAAFER